jgi:hypothetical protein
MAEGEWQAPVRRAIGQGPSPTRLDATDACYPQGRDFLFGPDRQTSGSEVADPARVKKFMSLAANSSEVKSH